MTILSGKVWRLRMYTPSEIENMEFSKEMRGYSVSEVNNVMTEIARGYEKIYQENIAAMDRIGMLSDAVKQYKSMEDTLKNALSIAKGASDDIKTNAHKQAQNIINNAESKATEIINRAAKEVTSIDYRYEEMKRSIEVFKAKVVSLLNSQLEIIKQYSDINIDTDSVVRDSAQAVDIIKSDVNDVPDISDSDSGIAGLKTDIVAELEKATQELPRISMDENGEFYAITDEE